MKKLILLLALFLTQPAFAAKKIVLTKDNTIALSTYMDETSTAQLAVQALEMDSRLPSNEPIYLVIDSGGGSIDWGIQMIENLRTLNRPVHTITLFSASMAFQTVQGLGKRYITRQGTLMSHKARGSFSGEFPGQLDNRYAYYLKRVQTLDVIASKRSGRSVKDYQNLIENEMWCDGVDCIKARFADELVVTACDSSLAGTQDKLLFKDMFMGHIIEVFVVMSKCPTNTGILDFSIRVDGNSLTNRYYDTNLTPEVSHRIKQLVEKATNKRNNIIKY